ncbi:MAG: hypothetical protein GF384_09300 [Elusimicrobia bacterium]|nr:hypothetical protein [Elusimicrobiota bacterium]MBD3412778.1 hypothetical protein [Elusimicrobiota bacterium]
MKRIKSSFICFFILGASILNARAEGTIQPPPNGGAIINPQPGSGSSGTPIVWVFMPEQPNETDTESDEDTESIADALSGFPSSYRFSIVSLHLSEKEIISATVSMKYSDFVGGQEYGMVDIAGVLRELQSDGFLRITLVVRYHDGLYTGLPIVTVMYEGGSGGTGVRFQVQAHINPPERQILSWEGFLHTEIAIDGEYGPYDIKPESLRITKINGILIDPVYGESGPGKVYIHNNVLSIDFDLWQLRGLLPAGDSITIRIDGNFNTEERFYCMAHMRVTKPGVQGTITPDTGGTIIIPGRADIRIPPRAVAHDIEITVDPGIADPSHIWNTSGAGPADYRARQQAMSDQKLTGFGTGVRFGPPSIGFSQPVQISLYYYEEETESINEHKLAIYYWNRADSEWEKCEKNTVSINEKKVTAYIHHFSIYRIMYGESAVENEDANNGEVNSSASIPFAKKEVYVFPNPAGRNAHPAVHIAVGNADSISVSFYTIAGEQIHAHEITGDPEETERGVAYEYRWNIDTVPSGVYICSIRARKKGYPDITEIKKIAVVK